MPPSKSPNYVAPMRVVLETAENSQNALLPIQQVEVEGPNKPCTVFFDSGSNTNLVHHAYAQQLGLPGTPVTQHLQVTVKQPKQWETFAYRVPRVQLKDIQLPTGKVDLLLGIHEARFFPIHVFHSHNNLLLC